MQGKLARSTNKVLNKGTKVQMRNQPNDRPLESADPRAKDNTSEEGIFTNGFYEPFVLPNHKGDLLQHVNAKLYQLDIRNVENDFIPSQD
jgi:hypothetical protein